MNVADYPLIVLAAGSGKRYGGAKGLIDAGGEPLIKVSLETFAAAGGRAAVVVVGEHADAYAAAMPEFATALQRQGVVDAFRLQFRVVRAEDPELGPFASLQSAIDAIHDELGAFVLPVDVPAPRRQVWQALAQRMSGDVLAVCPTFSGRGGHPVLLAPALMATFATLEPRADDSRLDWQLGKLGAACARVPVGSDDILVNLNNHLAIAAWQAARGY